MIKRTKRIKLLLVDDHPVVRKGIRSCLEKVDSIEIVGEAVDGEDAIAKVNELKPDVVLMDIEMPKLSGLDATRKIRSEFVGIKILILTIHNTKYYILQILRSGAQGYVLKDAAPEVLVQGIEAVYTGEVFFSHDISQMVLNQYLAEEADGASASALGKLSSRELEVLALIAEGQANKEIAWNLGVGVRTVETHRERVMEKLDIHSVAGLTKYAISNGIVKLDQSAPLPKPSTGPGTPPTPKS